MYKKFAVLLFAAAVTLSSAASAQTVLTIDRQRITTESAVGQHIAGRIQQIGQEMDGELQPVVDTIVQEGQRLEAETQALTPETIQQRPDLVQRIQAFEVNRQNLQRQQQIAIRELQASEAQALEPVGQALQTIVTQIAQERSALVVLEKTQTLFASASIDVTGEVIQRLNAQMSTTPVTRVRMPTQNGQ